MKACFYFLFVYLQRLFTFTTMRKRIKAILCAAVLVMPLMAQRDATLIGKYADANFVLGW
jgi:hypothetical protein